MKALHKKSGYSLIEVLVSISILLVVMAGPMTIASRSIQYAQYSRDQTTAFFLAQEGMEYFTALRNGWSIDFLEGTLSDDWWWSETSSDWAPCVRATASDTRWCGMDSRNNNPPSTVINCSSNAAACRLYVQADHSYSHQSNSEPSKFSRFLTITQVTPYIYKVTSVVMWQAIGGGDKSVRVDTYLYDIY